MTKKSYPLWSEEETKKLVSMVRDGKSYREIAARLNRTYVAVKTRAKYICLPPVERARANALRRELRLFTPNSGHRVLVDKIDVPETVIEERNQRLMAPRSLTAILMGDPEPNRRRA